MKARGSYKFIQQRIQQAQIDLDCLLSRLFLRWPGPIEAPRALLEPDRDFRTLDRGLVCERTKSRGPKPAGQSTEKVAGARNASATAIGDLDFPRPASQRSSKTEAKSRHPMAKVAIQIELCSR